MLFIKQIYSVIIVLNVVFFCQLGTAHSSDTGTHHSREQVTKHVYSVQVGSFSREQGARHVQQQLVAKGYDAFVVPVTTKTGRRLHRVVIGRYNNKKKAQRSRAAYRDRENRESLVIRHAAAEANNSILLETPSAFEKKSPANKSEIRPSSKKSGVSSTVSPVRKGRTYYIPSFIPEDMHIELQPAFQWKLYYEDNIAGSAESDNLEDFSNRYTPSIDASINSPYLSLEGSAELEIIEYFDEKAWNTVDQEYNLSLTYRPNRRLQLFTSGMYSVLSDPDRYFDTAGSDAGGGLIVRRNKNKTKTFSCGGAYSISPRSELTGFATLSNFETGVTDDSDFYTANIQYNYNLTRKTTLNLSANYSSFDFTFGGEGTGDTDFLEDIVAGQDSFELFFDSDYELENYNVSGGASHEFDKNLICSANVGWRYTKNDKTNRTVDAETGDIITTRTKTSGDSFTFSADLTKIFSRNELKIRVSQNVGTNPDTGASYENLRISALLRYILTNRLKGTVIFQYNLQNTDRGDEFGFEVDRDTYYVYGSLIYRYSRRLNIQLGYRYSRNENNISGSDRDRNSLFLGFGYRPQKPFILW